MEPIDRFTGQDGTLHKIYAVPMGPNGRWLIDLWEGHGARLLCALSNKDEEHEINGAYNHTFCSSVETQTQAVLADYRREASCAPAPLSRRVDRAELKLTPQTAASLA